MYACLCWTSVHHKGPVLYFVGSAPISCLLCPINFLEGATCFPLQPCLLLAGHVNKWLENALFVGAGNPPVCSICCVHSLFLVRCLILLYQLRGQAVQEAFFRCGPTATPAVAPVLLRLLNDAGQKQCKRPHLCVVAAHVLNSKLKIKWQNCQTGLQETMPPSHPLLLLYHTPACRAPVLRSLGSAPARGLCPGSLYSPSMLCAAPASWDARLPCIQLLCTGGGSLMSAPATLST